jgi:hypothetical protein
MTTTVPHQTSAAARRPSAGFRMKTAGTCLIAAPLAFAGAEVLAPESGGTGGQMLSSFAAGRTEGLVAALLGILSVLLFIPGVFGMLAAIGARGRRWANGAVAAIIYGLVTAHAALSGINVTFYAMTDPSLDRNQMVRLMDVLMNTPSAGLPLLLGHEVFGLGIIALGIAVIRSRVFPRWTGVALILWLATDVTFGMLPVTHILGDITSDAFGVAALATIGWHLLTRRTGSNS